MPNILYLVHRAPFPPDKGDRIRSFHLLQFLAQQGDVWLGCLSDGAPEPQVVERLQSLTRRLEIVPMDKRRWLTASRSLLCGKTATEGLFESRRLKNKVRQWTKEVRFDAVVLFCSSMAQYLIPELDGIPVLLDFVDVDSEKWLQYADIAPLPKRWLFQTEGRRLRRLEADIAAKVRAAVLTTEPEADILRSFQPNANVIAVANGVRSDFFAPQAEMEDESSCVFVGAMDYKANIEGVNWFARNVWPQIIAKHPSAAFRIVGRDPAPAVQSLASIPGIEIVGGVPDVRPMVAKSAISIAPLQIARGVQNKVLEALSMGKAVVATREALTGIAAQPGSELLEANSPEEWVQSLTALWDDPARRKTLGRAGREFVLAKHQWDQCLAPIAELIGSR